MTLEFQQGDATWKRLRKRALNDLFWFNSVVLGFADLFPLQEETHIVPHLFMERKTGIEEIDTAPYQLLMWPRETGKSSCGTVGHAIQLACKNPDVAILVANEKAGTAEDFIASIKHHFEGNELLRALFPEVIPPDFNKTTWSATRAVVQRSTKRPEPTFDSIGVGGTVTGKHYDIIICDDLISREAMENARSGNWGIMEKVNRWVNQLTPLLSTSAKPFPWIRFIGTRWWHGDTYEHIEQVFGLDAETQKYRFRVKLRDGRTIHRELLRKGDLAILRISAIEHGAPVFPDIWSQDRLEKERFKDPEFFSCNLLNDPSDAAVRTFDDGWLRYWRYVDNRTIIYDNPDGSKRYVRTDQLYRLMAVDPAFSTSVGSSRAALVVLGVDMETGKNIVLDVKAVRQDPQDTVTDILNMAHNWAVSNVYIELAGQQKAFAEWVRVEARRSGKPLNIVEVKPGGRMKDMRIEGLIVPFKNGDIYVHASQSELLDDEYRHWRPGAKLADVLDALAYALENSPKPHRQPGMDPKKRSQQQLQAYLARRGLTGATHAQGFESRKVF